MAIRTVYPIKHYSKKGFIERKLVINEEDLQEIIGDYLRRNTDLILMKSKSSITVQ